MQASFLNLHEAVLLLTIVETLFLCAALLLLPTKRTLPRNLLVVFFTLVVGTLATTLMIWNPYLQTLAPAHWSIFPLILSLCLLLQGPVLYTYLRSLSTELQLWQWHNLLHLLPPLLVAVLILVFKLDVVAWLPWNWSELSAARLLALKWVWALVKCLPLVYVLACFVAEYHLRQQLRQQFSSISTRELRWAEIILGGFFIHWLWSFVGYFLGDYLNPEMNDLVGVINNYFTVILVNSLFVFALLNTRQLIEAEVLVPEKAEPFQVSVDQADNIERVEQAIELRKLHLESQINLERFAQHIGLKPRELSVLLNSHYQQNFFEFINRHRIAEAQRLLSSPECAQETILDIIYRSGFNSQSAFHRFFKRIVGVTPSEYRKQTLQGES